jgi:hypothetical protein
MRFVQSEALIHRDYASADACADVVQRLDRDGLAYTVYPYLALAAAEAGRADAAASELADLERRLGMPTLPPFDNKARVTQLANDLDTCLVLTADAVVRTKMARLRDLARAETVPPAPVPAAATQSALVPGLPIKEGM